MGWKKPKIKHSAIINSYSEGGYKDVEIIDSRNHAIKIPWIKLLLDPDFHFKLWLSEKLEKPDLNPKIFLLGKYKTKNKRDIHAVTQVFCL